MNRGLSGYNSAVCFSAAVQSEANPISQPPGLSLSRSRSVLLPPSSAPLTSAQWLPKAGGTQPKIALMLIWFGANDAALPPSPQSVRRSHLPSSTPRSRLQLTIPEFKANLHTILDLLRSPSSPYYSPSTKFLLLTPPPVDAPVRNHELATRDYPRPPDRDSERTRSFAEAVQDRKSVV